jgi:hypothetical protein
MMGELTKILFHLLGAILIENFIFSRSWHLPFMGSPRR